jgi:carbonic anhydrase
VRRFVSFITFIFLVNTFNLISISNVLAEEEASPSLPSDILPQNSSDELPQEKAATESASPDSTNQDSESKPAAPGDEMTVHMHPKATPSPQKTAATKKVAPTKKSTKKWAEKKPKKKTKIAAAPVAKPTPVTGRPDGDTVLTWLKNGNIRFVKKKFRADGRTPADRERGLKGEEPNAAILTDSDSRVVPEIIFDQGLGEMYSVRTFGEAIDDSTLAALEYAVDKLNVPLIIVMGSSDSEAIGVLNASKLNENGDEVGDAPKTESLQNVVDQIRPHLKSVKHDPPSARFEVEAALNADGIARELVKKSPLLAKAVKEGHLKIQTALYRITTGKVSFY